MNRERAETLALEALAHVVQDDRLGPAFLDTTGVVPQDLAARAGDVDVMIAILTFLMQDDRRILDFCQATGRQPDEPAQALAALPGGTPVHWT